MKKTRLIKAIKTIEAAVNLIEKCGGPGGKPGPCPKPGDPKKPKKGEVDDAEAKDFMSSEGLSGDESAKRKDMMERIPSQSGKDLMAMIPKGTLLGERFQLIGGPAFPAPHQPDKREDFVSGYKSVKTKSLTKVKALLSEFDRIGSELQKRDPKWERVEAKTGYKYKHPDGHSMGLSFDMTLPEGTGRSLSAFGGGGNLKGAALNVQIRKSIRPFSSNQ